MKHLLAVILWFVALGLVAEAQQQIPVMPPNTVWGRLGANQVGPGGAIPFQTFADAIAPLIMPPTGYVVKPIAGSASLDSTYCGNIMLASGGFATITLGSPSGFPDPCLITIVNTDPGNGKKLNVSGLANGGFNLAGCGFGNICPGQSVQYLSSAGVWVLRYNPGAWRPIGSTVNYFVATNGDDNNDCLTTGTPCTLTTMCLARGMLDTSANANGLTVTINVAAGLYHGAAGGNLCDLEGNTGTSAPMLTFIVGAAPNTVIWEAGAGGAALFTKDLAEVDISNVSFIGDGGGAIAISGAQFSVADVHDVTFGNMGTGSISVQMQQSASFNLTGSAHIGVVSGAGCPNQLVLINLTSNANMSVASGGVSLIFDCAAVYNATLFNQGGFFNMIHLTWSGSGLAGVNATKMVTYPNGFGTAANGCVWTGTGQNLAAFGVPGNLDQAFPVGTCTDFSVATVFANIAPCNAGIPGRQYLITNGNTATWGAAVTGGGANQVLVMCNGVQYTVTGK